MPCVTVKTLQRLAGKCVSFGLVVPAARHFTREMNSAISKAQRSGSLRQIPDNAKLREEISHWLCLENWDDPLPWRNERHIQLSVATNACICVEVGRFYVVSCCSECLRLLGWEAVRLEYRVLQHESRDTGWMFLLDQAVINARVNQGLQLNKVLKNLFFTTARLNVFLNLSYIPAQRNPAEALSRRLSHFDSKLTSDVWRIVQREFGGTYLMALDSNAMRDKLSNCLPHFTPSPSPGSAGANLFA